MRFWQKLNYFVLIIFCGGLLFGIGGQKAFAEGIVVKTADLELVDDVYQLSATFDVGLTQTMEDAINRGLTLPFVIEYEITRPRWYLWNESLASGTRSRQISYNNLTRQYRLTVGSVYQNFDRLQDAKQVLSSVRGLDVIEKGVLRKGNAYEVSMRMKLDVSRLPKPFQVNALASKEWNLPSDWYRFSFTP
jgi:hypothetical protein